MRRLPILFLLVFAICAGNLFGQNPEADETKQNPIQYKEVYVKYEVDENAVFINLPKPDLTPEAIKNFVPQEIKVVMLLKADGTIDSPTFYGTLKDGMHGKILASIRKIKFKPAVLDGKKVTQRVHVKYGIKVCKNNRICTYAFEITE